jgi:hypothetical protein
LFHINILFHTTMFRNVKTYLYIVKLVCLLSQRQVMIQENVIVNSLFTSTPMFTVPVQNNMVVTAMQVTSLVFPLKS